MRRPDVQARRPCPNYQQTPHCRYDVYDNALAAIYLSKRGKLDEARGLLDAFIKLLYPGWAVPGLEIGGLPSNRSVTLLAASYTDAAAQAGAYQGTGVADGFRSTRETTRGSASRSRTTRRRAATRATPWWRTTSSAPSRAARAATRSADRRRLKPYPAYYRSTEHNTDMYALATILGDAAAAARARARARMYGQQTKGSEVKQRGDTYATGTGGAKACDATIPFAPVAADAQFWSLLAGADPQYDRKATALAFATAEPKEDATGDASQLGAVDGRRRSDRHPSTGGGKGERREGVRFTSWGNGAQWENSASAAMGLAHFGSLYPNASKELAAVVTAASIRRAPRCARGLLAAYGFVPASILGGNIAAWIKNDHAATVPGGSDTGIGWTYIRRPHRRVVGVDGAVVAAPGRRRRDARPAANPFAPPEKIASAAEAAASQQCIKPGKPGGGGAAAAAARWWRRRRRRRRWRRRGVRRAPEVRGAGG